jgi:hypothetical protein
MNSLLISCVRVFLSALPLLLAAGAPAQANAADGFQLRSLSAEPGTPQVLRAGVPVVLEFSGVWRDSCVPTVLALEGTGRQRVLRLAPRPSGSGCAAVLTPFARRLEPLRFADDSIGVVKVVVVEANAGWVSAHELVVLSANPAATPISAFNVDGSWFDPTRSGSGLLLQHRRAGAQESLSGIWFNFTPSGDSRWHVLGAARWVTPSRVEGLVYRASGQPYGCTAESPNPDCVFTPAASAEVDTVGLFSIEFEGADRAELRFSLPGQISVDPVPGRSIWLQKLQ